MFGAGVFVVFAPATAAGGGPCAALVSSAYGPGAEQPAPKKQRRNPKA